MNLMQKKVIVPVAAAAVIGTGIAWGSFASADSTTTNPRDSLIQKLADKFHVDKSQVQEVFDQHRTEMQTQMEQKYEDRLTQAVKDGQLTEDQKSKLLAKHKELQSQMEANRDANKDKTPEERRTAMEAQRTEIQKWASDNGVDAKWLMPMGGRGHGFGGPGGPGGPAPDDAPATSTN